MRVRWEYDQATYPDSQPVLGEMSSATRFVDGEEYTTSVESYDVAFRPLVTTVTLPDIPAFDALDGLEFSTEYTYTADGQVSSVSLPAVSSGGETRLGGEIVTTRFDIASMPSTPLNSHPQRTDSEFGGHPIDD